MKEMKYSVSRGKIERLAEGEYKGLKYYVLNMGGSHPCGYVDVTGTSLDGKDYCEIDIYAHGGLTYSEKSLATVEKRGWFIGWDYAHYGDYMGCDAGLDMGIPEKKYTTQEVIRDCLDVIDQIKSKEN